MSRCDSPAGSGVGPAERRVDVAAQQCRRHRRQIAPVPQHQLSGPPGDLGQCPHRRVEVSPDVHAQRAVRAGHRLDGGVGGGHGLPGRREEQPAGVGEAYAVSATLEQRRAEQGFQPRDPLGQRLLGEGERPGRPPEVQFLGGAHEGTYLRHVEIHGFHRR